jgi:recombination protein RecA
MSKVCPICNEGMPAAAPADAKAHPSCMRDHPEFVFEAPAVPERRPETHADWLRVFDKQFPGMLRTGAEIEPITYRTSGSLACDVAYGGYGIPRGRVIHLMGKEGAGKTRLFELAAIASQEEGLRSALFDFEGTFDPYRFESLGGRLDMLDLITADNVKDKRAPLLFGETAMEMAKLILQMSETHAYICFDSTGAMVSKAEYDIADADYEKASYGVHTANLISKGLRILVGSGLLARSTNKISAFFVSQSRDNIGVRGFKGMPPPDKSTGGRALPFYASLRLELSKGEIIKADVSDDETGRSEKQVEVGHVARVRVRKNKCNAIQGRVAELNFYTEGSLRGLDRVGELERLAVYCGVLVKSGSWFTPNISDVDPFRIQGKERMLEVLTSDKLLYETLRNVTRQRLATMMDASAMPETPEEESAIESEFAGYVEQEPGN